jgi:hypothetical protein
MRVRRRRRIVGRSCRPKMRGATSSSTPPRPRGPRQPPPTPRITFPDPSQTGHGWLPDRPDPLHSGHRSSPVLSASSGASSPGAMCSRSSSTWPTYPAPPIRNPGLRRPHGGGAKHHELTGASDGWSPVVPPQMTMGAARGGSLQLSPRCGRSSGIPIRSAQGGKTRESEPADIPNNDGTGPWITSRATFAKGFPNSLPGPPLLPDEVRLIASRSPIVPCPPRSARAGLPTTVRASEVVIPLQKIRSLVNETARERSAAENARAARQIRANADRPTDEEAGALGLPRLMPPSTIRGRVGDYLGQQSGFSLSPGVIESDSGGPAPGPAT